MTKKNQMRSTLSVLHKRLHEIEQQLDEAFNLPHNSSSRHSYSEEIHQKIIFLNNFLSAEIKSSPEKIYLLQDFDRRLEDLTHRFNEWNRVEFDCDSTVVEQSDSGSTGSMCSHHKNEVVGDFEEEGDGKKRVSVFKCFGVWSFGVVVGMVVMGFVMVRYFGCFHFVKHTTSVLTPT